jgi:RimJ/RimL family protein N-acetyltransferase
MIRLVPFNPCHLWLGQIKCDPVHLRGLVDNSSRPGLLTIQSLFTPDNILVAVFGVKHIHSGVGEAFMIPCWGFETHRVLLVKATRILIDYCWDTLGLSRIQAPIRPHLLKEIRFLEFFGFVKEGILKGYDPESHEDLVMYGRVKCP